MLATAGLFSVDAGLLQSFKFQNRTTTPSQGIVLEAEGVQGLSTALSMGRSKLSAYHLA